MIIAGSIFAYLVIAVIAGRLIFNYQLSRTYEKYFANISKIRKRDTRTNWDKHSSVEETALKLSKENLQYNDNVGFTVGLGASFWPFTLLGFLIFSAGKLIVSTVKLVTLIPSKAEREVSKAVAQRQRMQAIESKELSLEEERKRLLKLAIDMGITTKGLENLGE